MTSKTSSIAMFAVAAFAILGMTSMPSAFAASETDNFHNISVPADGNDHTDSETNSNECGPGESIYTTIRVANEDPDDIIKITADADDCGSHTNTHILIRVEGNTVVNYNTSNGYKILSYGGAIEEGDDVDITVTYQY